MSRVALLPNSRSDPDNIYYTASIINNNTNTGGTNEDPIARFFETRDVPILKDANDYECCVLKVSINGGGKTLPIFIPQIEPATPTGDYDINKTIYTVTLCAIACINDGGATEADYAYITSNPVPVMWVPENFDLGTPVPNNIKEPQQDTSYYYLYSYNHWVNLVNTALATAWKQLRDNFAAISGEHSTLDGNPPTIEFDEITKRFSFYTSTVNTSWTNTQSWQNDTTTLTEQLPSFTTLGASGTGVLPTATADQPFVFIGFNLNFEGLLTNFDTQFVGKDEIPFPQPGYNGDVANPSEIFYPENILTIRNKTGTNIQNEIDPTTGQPYSPAVLNYVTTQDFESISTLWSPVGAIVLTTQLLPLRNEFTSSPVKIGSGNLKNAVGSSAFQTVLLDFTEDFMTPDDFRGLLTFTPMAEFIPISMTQSHQEIKSMDFVVNWRNRLTNELVPLRIYNCTSINVRLLFRRKS